MLAAGGANFRDAGLPEKCVKGMDEAVGVDGAVHLLAFIPENRVRRLGQRPAAKLRRLSLPTTPS